jgi:hypothetical protein
MMLMINSILVNLVTGIAVGYEKIVKSEKGRIYLSGKWLINNQRNSYIIGYAMYYLIEIGYFLMGILPVILIIGVFGKSHEVLFVFVNVGVFISGYLYTSKASQTLFEKGIIREIMI